MTVLATLSINEACIPLDPDHQAQIIRALRDILARYEQWDRAAPKIVTHYIHTPRLAAPTPIRSADCGPDPVSCAG